MFSWFGMSSVGGVRLEQEPDVLAEERIRLDRRAAAPVRIGAMAIFCSLNSPAFSSACERRQLDEAARIRRILDQVAAVGEHRRLVDAAEAARRVDRAGEEREVLRQVRQVHLRPARSSSCSRVHLNACRRRRGAASGLSRTIRLPSSSPCTRPCDHLRLLLREAAVHDQHVGDDQQVAVGRQHVRLAAAAAHDLGDLRLPRHAARELVLARLEVVEEQIAGAEAVLGVDEVQPVGMRRRVEAAERVRIGSPASCAR